MKDLSETPLEALTFDPGARPRMAPIPDATEADRQAGQHLAAIHRHYLAEMTQVAAVLDRIKAGDAPPAELRHIVLHSDVAKNLAAAGTICGRQCQVLEMHHNIEEFHMFPVLEAPGMAALTAVVARLREEHLVVHELLNRLAQAAERLTRAPSDAAFAESCQVFDALRAAVTSHFGYEEDELAEAIGHYLGGV